jgi:hypothetical protein
VLVDRLKTLCLYCKGWIEIGAFLVELLEEVLGDHGLHYPNRGQMSFNSPVCDDGRNKHNLEVNYIDNVY